jgi:hypothetical protein
VNAHTTLTPEGNIPIPPEVQLRMKLVAGASVEIDEANGVVRLRPQNGILAPDLPRVTTEQLLSRPSYSGRTATIEEISSLSNEAILRVLLEQEQGARD